MEILDYSHNPLLVTASLLVALLAGFTGLSLTQGISRQSPGQRKATVAISAIALGGGIWSMHFVAMLGLQLPLLFYYDAVITLISALVAILVMGLALLLLHFRPRSPGVLTAAGLITGTGILAMHYIGMSGLELCRAVYSPLGIAVAVVGSLGLSTGAIWIAYGRRTHRNILFGTLCFGLAVFTVHFVAIAGTGFVADGGTGVIGPLISNQVLAIGVVLSSFVLCAAFLLTGVTFLGWEPQPAGLASETAGLAPAPAGLAPQPLLSTLPEAAEAPEAPQSQPRPAASRAPQVPYEKDGRTLFIDPSEIAALRAEGHYTYLYTKAGKLFCVWSITDAEKRLAPTGLFIKSHRSYLINPAHVSSFERLKDNGALYFEGFGPLDKVPVSRSRLTAVRESLGL